MESDCFNVSDPLPEISFEDLLDISPQKTTTYSGSTDSDEPILELNKSINTPQTKILKEMTTEKTTPQILRRITMTTATTTMITPTKGAIVTRQLISNPSQKIFTSATSTLGSATATATTSSSVSLNPMVSVKKGNFITISNKSNLQHQQHQQQQPSTRIDGNKIIISNVSKSNTNIGNSAAPVLLNNTLPKATVPTKVVRISTKSISSGGSILTGNTVVPTYSAVNKPLMKSGSEQILYIKKATTANQLTPIRSQQSNVTVSSVTNISTPSKVNTTTVAKSVTASPQGVKTHVMVAPLSSQIASGGSSSGSGISMSASNSDNKTVSIQVLRAGGRVIPTKFANVTSPKKPLLTVPSKMSLQLPAKNIINASSNKGLSTVVSGGLIKNVTTTPGSKTAANATTNNPVKIHKIVTTPYSKGEVPATPSTNFTITNSPTSSSQGKVVVQATGGKQFVLSNQNLIKISPKSSKSLTPITTAKTTNATSAPAVTASASTTAVSPTKTTSTSNIATGSQLKAVQIPGKPGMQIVRVLPNSKIVKSPTTAGTMSGTAIGGAQQRIVKPLIAAQNTNNKGGNGDSSSITMRTIPASASATSAGEKTVGGAVAKPGFKILNTVQKFTVHPSTSASITTSVKKPDGTGGSINTGRTVTSSAKNSTVTVVMSRSAETNKNLTKGPAGIQSSGGTQPSTTTNILNKGSQQIQTAKLKTPQSIDIVRKHKIANTDGPPEKKIITHDGNRYIVITPRSSGRSNLGNTTGSGVSGGEPSNVNNSGNKVILNKGSGHVINMGQTQKLYSVLKPSAAPAQNPGAVRSIVLKPNTLTQVQRQQLQQQVQNIAFKRSAESVKSEGAKKECILEPSARNTTTRTLSPLISPNNTDISHKLSSIKPKEEILDPEVDKFLELDPITFSNVVLSRRKHCNCSKSQCLKLYCDCFANGEFCQDCTCRDCSNNLEHEDERQRAIRSCLERNPNAFKPKITTVREQGDMRHNKGCNCKRSGCLKNYCECYEAKIPCSGNCKCVGCRNIEEQPDLDLDPTNSKVRATSPDGYNVKRVVKAKKSLGKSFDSNDSTMDGINTSNAGTNIERQPCDLITEEVIDATIQCLISTADQCTKNDLPSIELEKLIIQELGRCLMEIIDFSIRNNADGSFNQE